MNISHVGVNSNSVSFNMPHVEADGRNVDMNPTNGETNMPQVNSELWDGEDDMSEWVNAFQPNVSSLIPSVLTLTSVTTAGCCTKNRCTCLIRICPNQK